MTNFSPETAAYAAVFASDETQRSQPFPDSNRGQLLWPDEPNVRTHGEWLANDLYTAISSMGRVAFFGTCLASDTEVSRTLDEAIETNRPEVLADLPGDYSAVLERPGSLTVLADTLGQSPVYYNSDHDSTIVSSKPSLATKSRLQPDTNHIAAQLLIPGAEGTLLEHSSSFHDVDKLPSGHMLHVDNEGPEVNQYDTLAPDPDATLEETVDAVREALKSAMARRIELGLPMSSDLSGGLDSSSLAFLALNQLRDGDLPVFFSQPSALATGDIQYAEQYRSLDERLRYHQFTQDDPKTSFTLEDFLQTPRFEDLAYSININPGDWRYIDDYFRFIRETGSIMHITGDGGDEIMGANTAYLANLANIKDLDRFYKEGVAHARLRNTSPLRLLLTQARLARTNPASDLHQLAHKLETADSGDSYQPALRSNIWQMVNAGLRWLTPQTKARLADYLLDRASQLENPEGTGISDYIALNTARASAKSTTMLKGFAENNGLSMQTPFFDRDVVRAAFSLPLHLRGSPHEAKLLLGRALSGIVPQEVLKRRTKGVYSESATRSMHDSVDAMRRLMDDSYLADLGIVEPGPIRQALDAIDTMPPDTIWSLERVFSAEGWLRNLNTGAPSAKQAQNQDAIKIQSSAHTPDQPDAKPARNDAEFGVPKHVHTVASRTGKIVAYNRQANKYIRLDETRSDILRALAANGSLGDTTDALVRLYPSADRSLLESDAAQCLDELTELGLLQNGKNVSLRNMPTEPGPTRLEASELTISYGRPAESLHLKDRVLTAGGFVVAKTLERLSPKTKLPLLQYLHRFARREATYDEAYDLLLSAHSVPYLGRIACAEAPYASALAGALQRKKINWHVGASFSPLTFHAWTEAEGEPIRTDLEGQVSGTFQSFFEES